MLIWLVQSIFLKTVGQILAFCFMSAYISGLCLAVILAQRKRAVQLCSYSDKQKYMLQNHYTTLLQLSQLHVLCYWLQSVSMLKWQVFKMMDSHYQKFMSGNSKQFGLRLPKDFSYHQLQYKQFQYFIHESFVGIFEYVTISQKNSCFRVQYYLSRLQQMQLSVSVSFFSTPVNKK